MKLTKLILLVLTPYFITNAFGQESSNEKIWIGKSLLKDQGQIWSSPTRIDRNAVKYILPVAGAGTILYLLDENFTKQVIEFREKNPPFHDFAKNVTLQGETWAQGAMPIATMLAGMAFKDEKLKHTGAIMASSLINTQVITFFSKGFFGRQRPDYNDGNDKWHWFEFGTFDSFFLWSFIRSMGHCNYDCKAPQRQKDCTYHMLYACFKREFIPCCVTETLE